ncbi:MAG: glycosyltransferase family 4 protein [Candidatus Zixiibacteriota bacterium]|nr:MAG: glycosyltransferase family 4 protein [candidate division Zixibacteria bacterium]
MKILIITQHFPPERGAVRRLFEFARYFVRSGHTVSVLTAMPNYPDGIVPPKYRGKFFHYEQMDGVRVYRSWVLPASNYQPKKRMLGFLTFLFSAVVNSRRIKGGVDLLIASSPPVTTPVIGMILSKFYRCKFVLEIRDLQPESSEDFGNLNRSLFTRSLKRLMHYLYRKADALVPVTQGIADYLRTIGLPPEKVMPVKSGVSHEFISADSNGIRKHFGLEGKFLVLYSGTLGWAHSLETFIEAARQLNDQPDIYFAFIGDGQKRGVLEGMVRDYGLKNVGFFGLQPLDTIPYFLQSADVLVHSMKDVPVTKGSLPTKLFEYMASGKPIIYGSLEGEAVEELEKAGGALAFRADDPGRLCELILKLRSGEIDGGYLGRKYHEHVTRHHCREIWADRYLMLLNKLHSA